MLNLRMAVQERGERVVFLHRVERGAADRSYGIHVARLAGVPAGGRRARGGDPRQPRARRVRSRRAAAAGAKRGSPGPASATSAPLFAPSRAPEPTMPEPGGDEMLAELRSQDPDRLTPLEALQLLAALERPPPGRGDSCQNETSGLLLRRRRSRTPLPAWSACSRSATFPDGLSSLTVPPFSLARL